MSMKLIQVAEARAGGLLVPVREGGRAMTVRQISSMAVSLVALTLGGCQGGMSNFGGFGSGSQDPAAVQPSAPEVPSTIRSSEVVGNWGYAAFHKPEDRARTEVAARGQCSNPFVISQGPTGGVMMYLADQSELQELRLKGSAGNRNFIGPAGEPGGPQDREIVSFDGRVMVLRFTDPEVAGRYGTGVYVRCGPRPAVAQKSSSKKK
jgi:hypothetical protein